MADKYRNLGRNHKPTLGEMWRLMRTPRPKWRFRELERVADEVQTVVDDGRVRITFINHMTFLVQTHGLNVLTDPIWAKRCSPSQWAGPKRFARPGLPIEALPPIDAILLSHDHYDHLCLPTLRAIAKHHNPTVFAGKGVAKTVRKSGLLDVVELDWWDSVDVKNNCTITACPAQHFSGRTPFDRNDTLWLSLCFKRQPSRFILRAIRVWVRILTKYGDDLGRRRCRCCPSVHLSQSGLCRRYTFHPMKRSKPTIYWGQARVLPRILVPLHWLWMAKMNP